MFAFIPEFVAWANALFIGVVGLGCGTAAVVAIADRLQTKHAERHKYPLLHRLTPLIDRVGKILRPHMFAPDRAEMPFNRAQINAVLAYARNGSSITPFGPTNNLHLPGSIIFDPDPFPSLEPAVTKPVLIGPYCDQPYEAKSLLNISAMSYGAVSPPIVRAFSTAAKQAGCWMNTGEGGLAPAHLQGGGDIVFQMGTAKYGVGNPDHTLNEDRLRAVASHPQVRMIEIKLAQGAKPGEGGILPGAKVNKEIAEIRGIPEGVTSHSPARQVEAGNFQEYFVLQDRVRTITGKPTGCKIVIGSQHSADRWARAIARAVGEHGIAYAPDFITLDGGDGGTGAAPTALMESVGLPLRDSLPMLVRALNEHGLKHRIKIIASGKLITPERMAWALAAGADFVNNARGMMISAGCRQYKQCDLNTCPTGITTNDPALLAGLDPDAVATGIANYIRGAREAVEKIAHSCGLADPHDLRPYHASIVQGNDRVRAMERIYAGPE